MKLRGFVPSVMDIAAPEADETPGLPETVAYWTERAAPASEWFREVEGRWGTPGLVVRRGPKTLGYVVYAPVEYLPRALRFPVGPVTQGDILLAYAGGDHRTRKHLLVRTLREMRLRGVGAVEAIGSDAGLARHHVPTRHLLESGWEPVSCGRQRGLCYTLTRVELGNTVEVGELARGLIGHVKLPSLGKSPAPGMRSGSFTPSRTSLRPSHKGQSPERTPIPG